MIEFYKLVEILYWKDDADFNSVHLAQVTDLTARCTDIKMLKCREDVTYSAAVLYLIVKSTIYKGYHLVVEFGGCAKLQEGPACSWVELLQYNSSKGYLLRKCCIALSSLH